MVTKFRPPLARSDMADYLSNAAGNFRSPLSSVIHTPTIQVLRGAKNEAQPSHAATNAKSASKLATVDGRRCKSLLCLQQGNFSTQRDIFPKMRRLKGHLI